MELKAKANETMESKRESTWKWKKKRWFCVILCRSPPLRCVSEFAFTLREKLHRSSIGALESVTSVSPYCLCRTIYGILCLVDLWVDCFPCLSSGGSQKLMVNRVALPSLQMLCVRIGYRLGLELGKMSVTSNIIIGGTHRTICTYRHILHDVPLFVSFSHSVSLFSVTLTLLFDVVSFQENDSFRFSSSTFFVSFFRRILVQTEFLLSHFTFIRQIAPFESARQLRNESNKKIKHK